MTTTDTRIIGSHEIDPGSMGAGWHSNRMAALALRDVLRVAYARLGWTVDVSLGHRGSQSDDMDDRAAEQIDYIAERAFAAFCAAEGDEADTLAALVADGTIPAEA